METTKRKIVETTSTMCSKKNKKLKKILKNTSLCLKSKSSYVNSIDDQTAKFISACEKIIDGAGNNEDLSPFSVPYDDMQTLKIEAAKLKLQGIMKYINFDCLMKLLTFLSNNIKRGIGNTLTFDSSDNLESEETLVVNFELENINIAIEASLICLLILTSSSMDSKLYVEDVIDQIIIFTTFEIRNTINPSFKVKDSKNKNCFSKFKAMRKNKNLLSFTNKFCEILELLSELLSFTKFTDNMVLSISSLGVLSLFSSVQNLKLSSIKLLVSIFSHYAEHRKLIFDDVLSHLLLYENPLHPYKMGNGKSILLFTALSLQLIQSILNFSDVQTLEEAHIIKKWKTTEIVTHSFLTDFINKIVKTEKKISKSLFEIFLQDLSFLVKNPEWPAAEYFLKVLGSLSFKNVVNVSDVSPIRILSLECLCTISVVIKKNNVSEETYRVIEHLVTNQLCNSTTRKENKNLEKIKKLNLIKIIFLKTLEKLKKKDPSCFDGRQFYLVSWINENQEKINLLNKTLNSECSVQSSQKINEQTKELLNFNKFLKEQLLHCINNSSAEVLPLTNLSAKDSLEIVNYLFSESSLNLSFHFFSAGILKALLENSVVMRTKALKGLTSIIELEPSLSSRPDVEMVILNSLLDLSPLVRDSALDLIGKFIIIKPEFIPNYYPSLIARAQDTNVSVRKKVVRILMDIISNFPDLKEISEIHVKVLRRINDEISLQSMVINFYKILWFSPVEDKSKLSKGVLVKKVLALIDIITLSSQATNDLKVLFEKIFKSSQNLLKNSRTTLNKENPHDWNISSKQIIKCLMDTVAQLEKVSENLEKLNSCWILLHLFSLYQPHHLIPYATNLQPYLSLKCSSRKECEIVGTVIHILEEIVPLIKQPSQALLVNLEEDFVKIIMQHDYAIVKCSVSCLAKILVMTEHYKLLRDCFQFYYDFIIKSKEIVESNKITSDVFIEIKPSLNRSIYVIGLFAQYFDLSDPKIGNNSFSEHEVSENLMYFLVCDDSTKRFALKAIGLISTRYSDLLLQNHIKLTYIKILKENCESFNVKQEVLSNLCTYLKEEDIKFSKENKDLHSPTKVKIKELKDLYLGKASTIIQIYLDSILECLFHEHPSIRGTALGLINLILSQGLVYPLQIVPYLICLCSDQFINTRKLAEEHLLYIEKRYPGYSYMKALEGVSFSFKLQKMLKLQNITRGYRMNDIKKSPEAKNSFLYSLLKTKQQKRSFLSSLVRYFDENSKLSSSEMLFIADNLAYFPYKVLDEPLYVIHQIDTILFVSGSNMLQMFCENLLPLTGKVRTEEIGSTDEEDKSEEEESLLDRLPQDLTPLQQAIKAARGCILLGKLRQHLTSKYNISFKKIKDYTPVDANKNNEKNISNVRNTEYLLSMDSIVDRFHLDEWDNLNGLSLLRNYKEMKRLITSIGSDEVRSSLNSP